MCTTSSELGKVLRQQEVGLQSGEVINFLDFVFDFSTPTRVASEKWRVCAISGADFSEMRGEIRNPKKTSRGIRPKSPHTNFESNPNTGRLFGQVISIFTMDFDHEDLFVQHLFIFGSFGMRTPVLFVIMNG